MPTEEAIALAGLRALIEGEIRAGGAISFARYMELALYAPGLGYYERTAKPVGRRGDFYTSVSVGPVFGELLAFQFAAWLEELDVGHGGEGTHRWQLVEAGAHDGRLAADILGWLRHWRPALWERIDYWIIEPSAQRAAWQRETLADHAGMVKWTNGLGERPAPWVSGIVFSNELLDAFPARRLGWDRQQRRWFEWGVAGDGGELRWVRLDLADGEAAPLTFPSALAAPELLEVLPDGFTTEASPSAIEWWKAAATALVRGRLMTCDYGLQAVEFLAPQRARGTLRAYRGHHVSEELLATPGQQDLTAHVNFSALREAAEGAGLSAGTLESQRRFLSTLFARTAGQGSSFGEWTPSRLRQFQTLTHPEHLGDRFHVLIQSRG